MKHKMGFERAKGSRNVLYFFHGTDSNERAEKELALWLRSMECNLLSAVARRRADNLT